MQDESIQPTAPWYYERAGQHVGPVSANDIESLVAAGTLSSNTFVWRNGWADWIAVEDTELRGFLAPAVGGSSAPSVGPGTTWHYEWGGQRLGPLSVAEMQALIAKGTLTRGSLVWRSGLDAWTPVEDTELGDQLKLSTSPPLDGSRVNNRVVWALALSPAVIETLRYFIALIATGGNEAMADRLVSQNAYWVIGPIVSIALSYWDVSVLKKAGVNTQQLGQVWLVPVYLFKRAKALAQRPVYAWVWIGLFVLGLLVGA